MARLPECVRSSAIVRPAERPAAVLLGNLAEGCRLLRHPRLGAVEFEEQAWRHRDSRVPNRRLMPHLQRVDQFDARNRDAHLDGHDDRRQAASTVSNGHTPPEMASGMPCSLSVREVMMPSVPSAPTRRRVRS